MHPLFYCDAAGTFVKRLLLRPCGREAKLMDNIEQTDAI